MCIFNAACGGILHKYKFASGSLSEKGRLLESCCGSRLLKSLKAEEVFETVCQNQKEMEITLFEYIGRCDHPNRRNAAFAYLVVNESEQ